jgi:ribosomal silencing factor RsfS
MSFESDFSHLVPKIESAIKTDGNYRIYDDRIIASGTSEEQVRDVLAEILPNGKETHLYIYHYDP